jgi:hypothetical protein
LEKNFGDIVKYTRRPVDRRKVENRRLFLKKVSLDNNPERRVDIRRQNMGDRRNSLFTESHLSTERIGLFPAL